MRSPRVSLTWLLGAVTALASLIFFVSVGSFGRLLRTTSEQRLDRARDVVVRELARAAAEPEPGGGPPRLVVLGMRGGLAASSASGAPSVRSGLDGAVDRALETLVAVATARDEVVSTESEGGTVFLGARRRGDGRVVWVAYPVSAPKWLGAWRTTVTVLTSATVLVGILAIFAVVGTTRGARALTRSFVALERDLAAEVPRPAIAELAAVADGVAGLARGLADVQRDREMLQAELRHQERLAALGRVVAGVAHEVRNPLASIKLRVDVVRSTRDVPGDALGELDAIDEEIARLDRLVTDFLVVSGRRVGRPVDSDIGEIARKRVGQLAPWAKEHGVSITAVGSARARVDEDACARAVDNLVKNAIEASPPGAEVRVRVEDRAGGVAMTVEDDGPGVPEPRVHELFEPFFTTKSDGTGLGLAVSRAIAVASGGDLSYRREGGVTRFELVLAARAGDA